MVMINSTQPLVDLDGNTIEETATGPTLTLGRVISNALVSVTQRMPGQPPAEKESESLDLYLLALRLRDEKAMQPVMLTAAEVVMILKKVHEHMPPLVYAQVKLAIDPPAGAVQPAAQPAAPASSPAPAANGAAAAPAA